MPKTKSTTKPATKYGSNNRTSVNIPRSGQTATRRRLPNGGKTK